MQKNPEDKNLTMQEMLKKMEEKSVRDKIFAFSSGLRGTNAYWSSKRRELEAMITTIGVPHMFITLSSADRYWPELREFWLSEMSEEDRTEAQADKNLLDFHTRKLIEDPAVADTFFWQRFEQFVGHFFQRHWGATDFWFRAEYQSRGSPHVHGVLWMPDGVDLRDPQLQPEQFRQFIDKYVTCWNTGIVDGKLLAPNPSTDSVQVPASLKIDEIADNELDVSIMLHMLQHTRHGSYCERKDKKSGKMQCRFKYPRDLQLNGTQVKKLGPCKWSAEPQRNDPLLGTYSPQMLSAWRANLDIQPIRSPHDVARYLVKYTAKSETKSPELMALQAQLNKMAEHNYTRRDSAQRVVQQLLLTEVNERDYSAQETSHLLLQTPLVKTSRDFVPVSTSSIRQLSAQGECKNCLDKYMQRDASYENVTMYEYFSQYRVGPQMAYKRSAGKDAILVMSPTFSCDEKSPERREEFYRQQMLMFSVWRDEQTLKAEAATWEEAFKQKQPKCPLKIAHFSQLMEEAEQTVDEDLEQEEENEVTPDMTAANVESNNHPLSSHRLQPDWVLHLRSCHDTVMNRLEFDEQEQEAAKFDWTASSLQFPGVDEVANFTKTLKAAPAPSEAPSRLPAVQPEQLNEEQRRVFDFVKERLEHPDAEPVRCVLHGQAGTGKSYLISALRSLFGDKCLLLAPTGVAAFNIGGNTIHSALRIPVGKLQSLTGQALQKFQQEMQNIKLIIIDEMSMLSQSNLYSIDRRLRQAFPSCSSSLFGGRSIMLIGDFCQLKPVCAAALYTNTRNSSRAETLAGRSLFLQFTDVFFLQTRMRQLADPAFGEMLQRVRADGATDADWNLLMTRKCCDVTSLPVECVHLFPTNASVDKHNERILRQLVTPDNPICTIAAEKCNSKKQQQNHVSDAKTSTLKLAVGAKVMLLQNLSVTHGLVNGSLGIVRGICYSGDARPPALPACVFVEFHGYSGPSLTASRGEFAGRALVPITPESIKSAQQQGTSVKQLPLRLAWASTVHKSQGLTLDEAYVDLSDLGQKRNDGLVYTGLSRVKRLQSLHVSQCALDHFKMHTGCSEILKKEMLRLRDLSESREQ
jgi:DNA replication protein DnaC